MPPHLHAVMGSANLSLARGDTVAASELCMEVIRQGKSCYNNYTNVHILSVMAEWFATHLHGERMQYWAEILNMMITVQCLHD